MTRGKWVALVVGVAIVMILAPFVSHWWTSLVYVEEARIRDVRWWPEHLIWSSETAATPCHVLLERKRLGWLPGRDRIARCAWCVDSDHPKCPRRMIVWGPIATERRISQLHCDCPHPSHAEDSE